MNSANLFRISIASSTSFRDGGDVGSSGTSSSLLLPSSTVSTGCGRYSLTISSTDNVQDVRWLLPLYQNQRAQLNPNSPTALSFSPSPTIPWNGSSWSSIAPSWSSNETPDWLSETVSNCLLSHLTPTFLEHHHGIENWCSGQLSILVYHSNDLTNNQGSVFSLQWPEIGKKEKTYKSIIFGITRCFLKTLRGEEWT